MIDNRFAVREIHTILTVKVIMKLLIHAPSEWAGSMMSFSLCFRGCHPLRVLSVVRTRPEARHAGPDQYPLHTWDLTPATASDTSHQNPAHSKNISIFP